MRQTKKLIEAQKAIKGLPSGERGLMKRNPNQEDYYSILEKAGYWWDSRDQQWHKGDDNARAQGKFSGSIFEDGDGLPTGVFRLRVMVNPNEAADVCAEISRALVAHGMSIVEVSDPYPNRRGVGIRIYMTCKR
jgi:hypothetical protein